MKRRAGFSESLDLEATSYIDEISIFTPNQKIGNSLKLLIQNLRRFRDHKNSQNSIFFPGSYVPILSGITPLQSFGESNKKYFPQTSDCKQACASETAFTCTGFLWPAEGGDCYIFDKMNLDIDIFRNNQNSYVMYVRVCDGEATPAVGYCEFVQNQTSISAVTSVTSVSPGIAAETSCREFCIARYQGVDCEAYVVSPNMKQLSQCVLYSQVPSGLGTGTSNLYVKTCAPPPGKLFITFGNSVLKEYKNLS